MSMGVYIKGLEMPKSCAECPVNMNICKRGYKYLLAHMELYNQRADDCPLVLVPPHGRLIDADALAEHKFVCIPHVSIDGKDAGTAYRLGWNTAIEAVMENAETIIGGE
jgi:hypothetical protein